MVPNLGTPVAGGSGGNTPLHPRKNKPDSYIAIVKIDLNSGTLSGRHRSHSSPPLKEKKT